MSRNKKMLWIYYFITAALVSSDSVCGTRQQKGVCFKSNAFVDKIIVNNILGLGFNGSMVQTLLKINDLVISSDNGSIFKRDTFRKSQTWFTDVENGYNEMRQDVRQLKESFSSVSTQIKNFEAAQIKQNVRKLKESFSSVSTQITQIKNIEATQMKMFSMLQKATNEILKQQNALKKKLAAVSQFKWMDLYIEGFSYPYQRAIKKMPVVKRNNEIVAKAQYRGFNIIEFDGQTGSTNKKVVYFDPLGSGRAACNKMKNHIKGIKQGMIVVVFTNDEPSTNSAMCIQAIEMIGGKKPPVFRFRDAFALVGYKGKAKPYWVQQKRAPAGKTDGYVVIDTRIPLK